MFLSWGPHHKDTCILGLHWGPASYGTKLVGPVNSGVLRRDKQSSDQLAYFLQVRWPGTVQHYHSLLTIRQLICQSVALVISSSCVAWQSNPDPRNRYEPILLNPRFPHRTSLPYPPPTNSARAFRHRTSLSCYLTCLGLIRAPQVLETLMWRFPKIWGTILWVPIIRVIVFGGFILWFPISGNYLVLYRAASI